MTTDARTDAVRSDPGCFKTIGITRVGDSSIAPENWFIGADNEWVEGSFHLGPSAKGVKSSHASTPSQRYMDVSGRRTGRMDLDVEEETANALGMAHSDTDGLLDKPIAYCCRVGLHM